jgi:hypothetical protein
MRATAGVVRAARIAGVPLVPVTFAVSRRRVLSSWDRFVLPLPFARGVIAIGAPIEVADDAGPDAMERVRGELEAALNDLTREADARFGFAPIGPALADAAIGRPDAKHSTEAGLPAEASAKAGR